MVTMSHRGVSDYVGSLLLPNPVAQNFWHSSNDSTCGHRRRKIRKSKTRKHIQDHIVSISMDIVMIIFGTNSILLEILEFLHKDLAKFSNFSFMF